MHPSTVCALFALGVSVLGGCGRGAGEAGDAADQGTGEGTESGTESGDGDGDGDCSGLEDDPVSQPVTVTVRNQGSEPLYIWTSLGDCDAGATPVYAIDGVQLRQAAWQRTCAEALDALPCGAGDGCGGTAWSGVYLDVDGVYETQWSGLSLAAVDLPAACEVDASCVDCLRAQQVPAGDYMFRVVGDRGCDPIEGGCSCTPNADGWCDLSGNEMQDTVEAQAVLAYPGATSVELVFQ